MKVNTNAPIDIGEHIKSMRKQRGLKQSDLAELANMSQSAISYIESGEKSPNIDSVILIANALEVTVAELFETKDLLENEVQDIDIEEFLKNDNITLGGLPISSADKTYILNLLNLLKRKHAVRK